MAFAAVCMMIFKPDYRRKAAEAKHIASVAARHASELEVFDESAGHKSLVINNPLGALDGDADHVSRTSHLVSGSVSWK